MASLAAVAACSERLPATRTAVLTVWFPAVLVSAATAGGLLAVLAALALGLLALGAGTLAGRGFTRRTTLTLCEATVGTQTGAGFYSTLWAAAWADLLGFFADLAARAVGDGLVANLAACALGADELADTAAGTGASVVQQPFLRAGLALTVTVLVNVLLAECTASARHHCTLSLARTPTLPGVGSQVHLRGALLW